MQVYYIDFKNKVLIKVDTVEIPVDNGPNIITK